MTISCKGQPHHHPGRRWPNRPTDRPPQSTRLSSWGSESRARRQARPTPSPRGSRTRATRGPNTTRYSESGTRSRRCSHGIPTRRKMGACTAGAPTDTTIPAGTARRSDGSSSRSRWRGCASRARTTTTRARTTSGEGNFVRRFITSSSMNIRRRCSVEQLRPVALPAMWVASGACLCSSQLGMSVFGAF